MLASEGATGLFVAGSKEGQRPPGEPHVYGWTAMLTAMTTDPALSAEDKQKVVTYTSSATSPETFLQSIYWSQCQKNSVQKDWIKSQCSVDSILCLIIKAMNSRRAKEKFGQAPAGDNVRRTSTYARRSLMQAGQQLLTSWIRLKMPSNVQSGTGDRGGQRLLTSWVRLKSSSAPTVSSAPVSAMEYTSPAPEVYAATVPVVENIFPAPVAILSNSEHRSSLEDQ